MKRALFGTLILVLMSACNNDTNISDQQEGLGIPEPSSNSLVAKRFCPSEEIRQEALANSPELRQKFMTLEANTEKFVNNLKLGKVLEDGSVEVPVIVNVLYRTNSENVSEARIAEQIAVLNADYSSTNTDINKIPSEFGAVKSGDTKIKFKLVNIVRKSSPNTSWSASSSNMKAASTGGINSTNPTNYLNIWVVNRMYDSKGYEILGYATFPESAGAWNDGVVIALPYFGKTGTRAPYNLGRTATHEVGHYFNLRHIWGDADCGNDFVADTPTQKSSNSGQPSYPLYQTCGGVSRSVMFMNYMDYVNDAAMFMFSAGQKARMQSIVNSSGARAGLRVL